MSLFLKMEKAHKMYNLRKRKTGKKELTKVEYFKIYKPSINKSNARKSYKKKVEIDIAKSLLQLNGISLSTSPSTETSTSSSTETYTSSSTETFIKPIMIELSVLAEKGIFVIKF